jgi:Sulfotransferase family
MVKNINSNKPVTIFLHIPKAGGSTLRTIIARQYDRKSVFITSNPPEAGINKFKKLSERDKKKYSAIMGHLDFGFHELLPEPLTYTYITMLREPIARAISQYYWIRQTPRAYGYKESQSMSLPDFIQSGIKKDMDNCQTRFLSGKGQSIAYGECSRELLEIAKKNIQEKFAVAGLLERYDETLILYKKYLGWNFPLYIKENITYKKPKLGEISETALAVIKKYNEYDLELYQYVKERFEELIGQQSEDFARELKEFKSFNTYQPLVKSYYFYRSALGKINSLNKKIIKSK